MADGLRVAVIGGGITGLAAAHRLVRRARGAGRPLAVTLLEADGALGGKVRTEVVGALILEQGPDSFLTQKPWAAELCWEVGLGADLVGTAPEAARAYIACGCRLEPLPDGLILGAPTRLGPLLGSRLLSPWGKLRAALEPLVPPIYDARDLSVGAFFRRRIGAEASRRIAEPLLSGVHAGDAGGLSLQATFPQLLAMERQYGSLTRGFRRVARARRQSGRSSSVFQTVRGGLARMVAATRQGLDGVRIVTGARVLRIEPEAGGSYRVRLEGGTAERFDAVLVTVPAHAAAGLVESWSPDASAGLSAIRFASTAVVAFAYPRAAVAHPMAGSGFLVPEAEGRTLTACTWVSAKWAHAAPPDTALLRCYVGRAGDDDRLRADDAELVRAVGEDLRELMGLDATPGLTRVFRWPRAMPQYAVGHLDAVVAVEAALAGHPRVRLAGGSYRGVGLPDCIRQGWEAADAVWSALGLEPESSGAGAAAADAGGS